MVVRSTEYVEIFLSMPCLCNLLLAIFKSYKMVVYRPVFNNLVWELRSMWPQGTVTEEEDLIVSRALRSLNMVVKGYYWCNILLVLIFLSPSFVALGYRAAGHDTPLILPYWYWYPFDPYEGGAGYALALAFEDFHGCSAIGFMVMGDLLFCIFLSHISIQFDLLAVCIKKLIPKVEPKHRLSNFVPGAFTTEQMRSENCDTPEWEKNHLKELAAIIERHRALIRLSGDVEEMFSGALLLNFLNSSMIFCFCGFCSVIVEKWNEFSYKSFLVTALAQTYLLCAYGQKIIDSSKGITDALYSCLWYNASKKVKSSVLIAMHRSQKEIHVTTYGFSVINMASYATILKTAWSYLSLLLNVYK
ncbi:odorant receptor 4-like [Cydia fagiglandana]|uniref:odorant receptor 4-like n=1 Tax=Cydia fagiglandana TaxID=1458189 RepID=UPI002FEE29B1